MIKNRFLQKASQELHQFGRHVKIVVGQHVIFSVPCNKNRMAQWTIPSFSNLYAVFSAVAWMSGAGSRNLCLACKGSTIKKRGAGAFNRFGGPGFKKTILG